MDVTSEAAVDLRRLLRAQHAVAAELSAPRLSDGSFDRILATLCDALGWSFAAAWQLDSDLRVLVPTAVWNASRGTDTGRLAAMSLGQRFERGRALPGLVWATGETTWVPEPVWDPRIASADASDRLERPSAVGVPLGVGEGFLGVLEFFGTDRTEPAPEVRLWLEVIAAHVAQHLASSRTEQTLRERDRALTHAVNGVVIADATIRGFPIVYANPGFERLTGWSAAEIEGRPCSVLQHPDAEPAVVATMRRALAAGGEAQVTVLNRRKDGTPFWSEVFLSPVFDPDGRLVEYVGVQNDVTERRKAEEQADFLAYHDSLTGLANRAQLARVLERAAARVDRDGVQAALAFIDLDGFKQLNDVHGHAVGDRVLRQVADRLRGVARPEDLLVRQGGDEFLMLMPDLEPRAAARDALATAERVRLAIAEPMLVNGEPIRVRASVGVSLLGRDAHDPAAVLRHADTAMYRAKRVSRGGVRLYRDTGPAPSQPEPPVAAGPATGEERQVRAGALDDVLARGTVTSVYQPIVDLETGDVVAFEALARGPVGSPVQNPDDLFRTARETGRTGELDWACRGAALRGALGAGLQRPHKLFINVEADALGLPCPVELAAIRDRAVAELDVVVEITERALTAKPADLLHFVREVRRRGWGIALDDVGADVRALAVMPLLRPDVIKLDLRLVQENPTSEIAEIISAVNAERERTGAVVLAEGIETQAHVAIARTMGATLGQGWFFGRPGPLAPPKAPPRRPVELVGLPEAGLDVSPFSVVSRVREVRRADEQLLFSISLQLEEQAAALGESALLVSAFQHAERFTPRTAKRYALLAADTAMVAALGVGMAVEPVPGVRGADLPDGDPLRGEWSVVVLGPHFAGALVALDLGEDPDGERRFDFAVTYDRTLVIEAASALMRRVQPGPG